MAGEQGNLFGPAPAHHWVITTRTPIRVRPGVDASTLWATWFQRGDDTEIATAIVTRRWWGGRWQELEAPVTVQIPLTNIAGWVWVKGDDDP